MSKLIWNAVKLSPAILVATLVLANRVQATEASAADLNPSPAASQTTTAKSNLVAELKQLDAKQPQQVAQNLEDTTSQPSQSAPAATTAPETSVSQLSNPQPATMAQVTSVSQLSDVQPTDWAFQALQSLVERYGCIAGYPDGTYRGNRALTRYEFAAGLNACLDRVNELIATATADGVNREDLATLQRLQEEFAAELATLRGRVDALEAQTAELEANQFSTTTKLTGEVVAAVADVFDGNVSVPSNPEGPGEAAPVAGEEEPDVNTILGYRARLNFDTSFTGRDLLRTRLQARNITPFNTDVTGTNMTRLGFDGDSGGDVEIDDFFYRFNLGGLAEVKLDFANAEFNDNVYTFNPLFESSGRGAISRFGRFNPIYRQGDGGAGITVNLNPEGVIGVSLGYLATEAEDPGAGAGLFNGGYAALGQVSFRPSDNLNVGLTYVHTYDQPSAASTGSGFANDPFDGLLTSANHYGVQANLKLGPLNLGGWGGLSYTTVEDGSASVDANTGDSAESFNWAATLGVQDFGKEGSVLGVIFGQPPKLGANSFATGPVREDDGTSYHLEGLYRFPLTENIEITPGVVVIFNPEHNNDNDTIYVGTLRTTFRF